MNKKVTGYISRAPNGHNEIMEEIREMVHASIKKIQKDYKCRCWFSKSIATE